MLVGGATTFLSNGSFLPLWITWIAGPLLWYLGFAVAMVWGYHFFFDQAEPESQTEPAVEPQTTTVVVVRRQHSQPKFGTGPVGVMHEIPAMGGFIL